MALVLAHGASADAPVPENPEDVLARAQAAAVTIPKQAEALALLAWPDEGPVDFAVSCAARDRLVKFGHHALPALRAALTRVDPLYSADVTSAFIAARWWVPYGEPPDYLPGLVDALWYGSPEAQRLAMLAVRIFQFPPAVTAIIDAVEATPALTPVAAAALERMRDPRGRFLLQSVLVAGPDRWRPDAAQALSVLGPEGLEILRESVVAEDPAVRRAALDALLPVAQPDDLTRLYEYLDRHGDEDPELARHIRARAVEIEQRVAEAPPFAEEE
jgi:hypothetical protein